jgi:hypothetical protein
VIVRAFRAARLNVGAVTWTYLASLMLALPLAIGAGTVVSSKFGRSLEATAFAARLDASLLAEFVRSQGDALLSYAPMLAGAMIFWGALTAFFSGAVIMAVSAEEAPLTGAFFSGGGRVFGRLLRLVLLGLGFTVVTVGAVGAGIWFLAEWAIEDWISEKSVMAVRVGCVLLTALALAWVNGAYDLMKVEAVAKGEHRARWAFWRGLRRAARHPLELLRVYLPFVGAGLVLTVLSSLLDVQIARSSWLWVIVGIVLQQATAFARAMLRVGLAAAEVAWVRGAR